MDNAVDSKVLGGHVADVWDVKFTSDGNPLISISEDHTARIWSIAYGFALWKNSDPEYHYNIAIASKGDKDSVVFDGASVWEFDTRAFSELSWGTAQAERPIGNHTPFSLDECLSLKIRAPTMCFGYTQDPAP